MSISVVVAGGYGRIGGTIVEQVKATDGFELSGILRSTDGASEREALAAKGIEVVVDATNPEASRENILWGLSNGANVLVATSGWDAKRLEELRAEISEYSERGVLVVPNFSVGSILSSKLATIAATLFPSLEISETHHAKKKDAPSGTAIRTAENIIDAIKSSGKEFIAPESGITGEIDSVVQEVPVHSYRQDGVPTSQQVDFYGLGEQITINHQVFSYDSYRQGIDLALAHITGIKGLEVGLEKYLGLK